uniref:Uncharacterized protein n=1 Tax=Arundo donax TaxID=35708 RepID=A0A0A9U060_ARUDO
MCLDVVMNKVLAKLNELDRDPVISFPLYTRILTALCVYCENAFKMDWHLLYNSGN